MQPDAVNFETLASVYGEIGGTRPPVEDESSTIPPSGSLAFPQPSQPNQDWQDEKDEKYEDEADRRLRDTNDSGFPSAVRRRLKEIDEFVNGGLFPTQDSQWRVLHESQHGRALEVDLGEGYRVQLHFLLASEEDYPTSRR